MMKKEQSKKITVRDIQKTYEFDTWKEARTFALQIIAENNLYFTSIKKSIVCSLKVKKKAHQIKLLYKNSKI